LTSKKCKCCGEERLISDYYRSSAFKSGRQATCIFCISLKKKNYHIENKDKISKQKKKDYIKNRQHYLKVAKKYRDNMKSGKYYVYYLPEEHYIGITDHPKGRISRHKYVGKITDCWEIVAEFDNPFDAVILEAEFHRRGYNGFQYIRE